MAPKTRSRSPKSFFTVGHGRRSLNDLASLLQENGIKTLVDVRTIPYSRTNPQFSKDKLEAALPSQYGIHYRWLGKELGGLRKRNKRLGDNMNAGWYNVSFRAYADYMQSEEFKNGLEQLLDISDQSPICYMCAEQYYKRCHRSLISDALLAHGYEVKHIVTLGKEPAAHEMTKFAKEEHGSGGEVKSITYPLYEGEAEEAEAYMKKKKSSKAKKEGSEEVKQPKIDKFVVEKKAMGKRKKERRIV